MTEAEILGEIERIAVGQLRLTRRLAPEDSLLGDLDLDSVELISLAIGVEERFDIELPPETSQTIRTVGDLCRLIAKIHSDKAGAEQRDG